MNVRPLRLALVPWLVVFAALLSNTSGCSLLFVKSPPSDPSEQEVQVATDCTSSSTLPVLDVTGTVASGANVALVGASSRWTDDEKKILIPLHLAYGVLYGISAIYGFHETAKCRELKKKFEHDGGTWSPATKTDP